MTASKQQWSERVGKGAEARAERTRAAITAAAADHFLDRGFLGTNMDDIAAAAGVSKQTVYAHFESKEALFLAMVRGLTGGAADEFAEQLADPTGEQPIERFLLDFATLQLRIVMTPRLMQLRRLVIGEVGRFPQLGQALHQKGPQHSIGRLARAFAVYRASGALAVSDERGAATVFNWLIMGAPVNDAMLLGDDAILDDAAILRHASEVVRIFLAAYGHPDRNALPPSRSATRS
jgi:TetR/AcrR family transcriptional repressor of mexJK operon